MEKQEPDFDPDFAFTYKQKNHFMDLVARHNGQEHISNRESQAVEIVMREMAVRKLTPNVMTRQSP